MSPEPPPPTAPHFTDGAWGEGPDVVARDWPEESDVFKALQQSGYSEWACIGDGDALAVPLTLTIFTRVEEPQFYISVEGNKHSNIYNVYVRNVPDLMELLAKWVPTVQAAAVTDLVQQLNDPYEE